MEDRSPKFWIIVASKDHVKKGVEGGFAQAGHGKSAPLKRMSKGDYIEYYSGKETLEGGEKCQEFTAIGKIKEDQIYQVTENPDFHPNRLNVNFFKAEDIPIKPLLEDLDFIENIRYWGFPLMKGVLEINQHDFELISQKMLKERF
ncbi:MAG: EVE domain-containing protein [Saprospiraceae bacterium]